MPKLGPQTPAVAGRGTRSTRAGDARPTIGRPARSGDGVNAACGGGGRRGDGAVAGGRSPRRSRDRGRGDRVMPPVGVVAGSATGAVPTPARAARSRAEFPCWSGKDAPPIGVARAHVRRAAGRGRTGSWFVALRSWRATPRPRARPIRGPRGRHDGWVAVVSPGAVSPSRPSSGVGARRRRGPLLVGRCGARNRRPRRVGSRSRAIAASTAAQEPIRLDQHRVRRS